MLWYLCKLDKVDYDEYDSFVVRADTSKEARQLAADESFEPLWKKTSRVACKELKGTGPSGIVLGSFNAG